MSKIQHPETKPTDKRHKPNTYDNGKLTEAHLKCGSLKGKIAHWSNELRCWMFLKPGTDFLETEQRYIEQKRAFIISAKKDMKSVF
jgi:hypothetical protein